MQIIWAAGVASVALAGGARAEVASATDNGFTSRNAVEISARADRVYAALGEVGKWWSNEHTYSGSAANMTMPLKPGACFCEALPEGGVAHGTVVLAWPARQMLRVHAALGPLQEMGVSGALTWEVKPKSAGVVEVVQTYAVGGTPPGFAKQAAGAVDAVLKEALQRFERYMETGKP